MTPPHPPTNTDPLGARGEQVAADYLANAGWTITHRNFRTGRKEIDIVARRGDLVAFVEVKSRAGTGFGHPLEAVTRAKRREIQQVAANWITLYGRPADIYRFDAIALQFAGGSSPQLEHVEDAWRMNGGR